MQSACDVSVTCQMCSTEKPRSECVPAALIRDQIVESIRKQHADWSRDGFICHACLDDSRASYVAELLQEEKGELTDLEAAVVKSLQEEELLAKDLNKEFESQQTFGQRIADKIAEFGGSWSFILSFLGMLGVWIIINSIALLIKKPFDPFPYILLNLVLSCVASIQAPVIMMSQNRQESKDRLRAEHDYQVNLKAEVEIRSLHQKIDHLLTHQFQRLGEIQQVQLELMDEIAKRTQPEAGESK